MNVKKIICTTHGRLISTLNFQVKGGVKAWAIYVLLRLVIECENSILQKITSWIPLFFSFFFFYFHFQVNISQTR